MDKPKYRTWIRVKKAAIFACITIVFLFITFLPINFYFRILSGVLSLPFAYITFILTYSIYQFSPIGGDYQSKIHELIAQKISVQGKILDIGTGSGSLITKVAKKFPESQLTGIDYWGENWEYSREQCVRNAALEGVASQIHFLKASASSLPFRDGTFDVVASCLTFHEVQDTEDKNEVIVEALRVLKSGGQFVFMDLFMDEKIFDKEDRLLENFVKNDVYELNKFMLAEEINLPKILLNKKVLGNAVVISGRKL